MSARECLQPDARASRRPRQISQPILPYAADQPGAVGDETTNPVGRSIDLVIPKIGEMEHGRSASAWAFSMPLGLEIRESDLRICNDSTEAGAKEV